MVTEVTVYCILEICYNRKMFSAKKERKVICEMTGVLTDGNHFSIYCNITLLHFKYLSQLHLLKKRKADHTHIFLKGILLLFMIMSFSTKEVDVGV